MPSIFGQIHGEGTIGGRIAFKSGHCRAKIKLHISDEITVEREAERRVDPARAVS
jgi:hypothetical protein